MRRLGVDPGDRRVGLAISERGSDFAHPHRTLRVADLDGALQGILEAAREAQAEEIVLGLPLLMNGDEGPAARKARALAERLEHALQIPVVLWDERLTTVLAQRQLSEAGRSTRAQREVVDEAAATVLLQSYLDAQRAASHQHAPATPVAPSPSPARRGRPRPKKKRRR